LGHISPNNIQMIQLRKVIWAGRVVCGEEEKYAEFLT
jgi:hypothetical protein